MATNKSEVLKTDGDLQGLWTIDGKKAREQFGDRRFWRGVDEIVKLFKQINTADYESAIRENTQIKFENTNKYGSNKGHTFRQALNIPHGLYLALTDYEPTLFRNKKTREAFMKRFAELRACDVV